MLLAGDIGGTKTRLAVFTPEAGPRAPLAKATYSSIRYVSLEALVREFLASVSLTVERASFGVAGPVVRGHATITNLPWVMDEGQLQESLNLSSVKLQNDLEVIAHAVPILQQPDLHNLNEGEAVSGGTIAVIAPGTGLGEAFLVWDGSRYQAHASEGGHADFAPNNDREIELLRYLQKRFHRVSYERVCSGMGFPNIYAFLKDSGYAEEPSWLTERLATADDPTPVIFNGALEKRSPCELCVTAVDCFVSILGAEAGNLALKVLATGGVYLAGGIPPRILSTLDNGRFMEAFRNKGRLSDVLHRVPVHVILAPEAALLGAAYQGLML